jgi:histidinol-phosphate aminotransferase
VIPLIGRFSNLIVAQTFSKNRSLAGMRVGYAAASPGTIAVLKTVKNSFNSYPLDRISQEVAVEALSDPVYFEETRTRIMRTRERTVRRLGETGFRVIPSKANFIFVSHPELGGEEIYRKLKDRGILVRYFGKPGIEDFVRISIGTDEEMNALHAALEGLIREKGGTG